MTSDLKAEPEYHIFLDWPVARRLRRHVLTGPGPDDVSYWAKLDRLLEILYEKGITSCLVTGETAQFSLSWSLPPPDLEVQHGQTTSPAP